MEDLEIHAAVKEVDDCLENGRMELFGGLLCEDMLRRVGVIAEGLHIAALAVPSLNLAAWWSVVC